MSQNDFSIANADGATVRADMNSAVQALASLSSGATAPSTTYAYQLWVDTANGLLKQRNSSNTSWITLGDMDGSNALALATAFRVPVDTLSGLQGISTSGLSDGDVRYLLGRTADGDGGQGVFYWDSTDFSSATGNSAVPNDEVTSSEGDGGVYVAPASDKTGASGAWVRQFSGPVNLDWWGQSTDFGERVNRVLAAGYVTMYLPEQDSDLTFSTQAVIDQNGVSLTIYGDQFLIFDDDTADSAIDLRAFNTRIVGGSLAYKTTSASNANWSDDVSGIRFYDGQQSYVDVDRIYNFNKGIHIKGGPTRSSNYNVIDWRMLWTNKHGIYIEEGDSSANESQFRGERITTQGGQQGGDWGIYIADWTTNAPNNHAFFGVSCEGDKAVRCAGKSNNWYGLRLETGTDAGTITFTSQSVGNAVFGCTPFADANSRVSNSGTFNMVYSDGVMLFYGGGTNQAMLQFISGAQLDFRDLSGTDAIMRATATTETPTNADPSSDPVSGHIKILIGGSVRYIPFYS